MKKNQIALAMVLFSTTFMTNVSAMSSSIRLPIPDEGIVQPLGGKIMLPLSGVLLDNIFYDINCHIDNQNSPEGIIARFSLENIDCSTMGYCGGLWVNNSYNANTQINLSERYNLVTFTYVSTLANNHGASIVIQNLDTTEGIAIKRCVATPTIY